MTNENLEEFHEEGITEGWKNLVGSLNDEDGDSYGQRGQLFTMKGPGSCLCNCGLTQATRRKTPGQPVFKGCTTERKERCAQAHCRALGRPCCHQPRAQEGRCPGRETEG